MKKSMIIAATVSFASAAASAAPNAALIEARRNLIEAFQSEKIETKGGEHLDGPRLITTMTSVVSIDHARQEGCFTTESSFILLNGCFDTSIQLLHSDFEVKDPLIHKKIGHSRRVSRRIDDTLMEVTYFDNEKITEVKNFPITPDTLDADLVGIALQALVVKGFHSDFVAPFVAKEQKRLVEMEFSYEPATQLLPHTSPHKLPTKIVQTMPINDKHHIYHMKLTGFLGLVFGKVYHFAFAQTRPFAALTYWGGDIGSEHFLYLRRNDLISQNGSSP